MSQVGFDRHSVGGPLGVPAGSFHHSRKSELLIPCVPEVLVSLDVTPLRTLLESLCGVVAALDARVLDGAAKTAAMGEKVKSFSDNWKEKETSIYTSLWAADRAQMQKIEDLEAKLNDMDTVLSGVNSRTMDVESRVGHQRELLQDIESSQIAAKLQDEAKGEQVDPDSVAVLEESVARLKAQLTEGLDALRFELTDAMGADARSMSERVEQLEEDLQQLVQSQLSGADAATGATQQAATATSTGAAREGGSDGPLSPAANRLLVGSASGALLREFGGDTGGSEAGSRPRSPCGLSRLTDLVALRQEIADDIERVRAELERSLASKANLDQIDASAGELRQAVRSCQSDVSELQARLQNSNPAMMEVNLVRLRMQVSGMEGDLDGVKKRLLRIQDILNQQGTAAGVSNCISCFGHRSPSPEPQRLGRDGKTLYIEPHSPDFFGEPPPETARGRRARPTTACGLPAPAALGGGGASPSIPGVASRGSKREEAALGPFDLHVQRGKDRKPELFVARSAGGSHGRPSTPGRSGSAGLGKAYRESVLVRQEQLQADYLQRAAADRAGLPA